MVIWALYDDGNGCWNQLKIDNLYSIGINDNPTWENYFQVDLSVSNQKLIQQLKKIEKQTGRPDLIVASPPCESWSIADNVHRLFRTIDKKINKECKIAAVMSFFTPKNYADLNAKYISQNKKHLTRDYYKQVARWINGIQTITACKQIIEYYNCDYLIENPRTSKIWDYCKHALDWEFEYKNIFFYNNWNENYTPKPTLMCGSFEIEQTEEQKKFRANGKHLAFGRKGFINFDYNKKSEIPQEILLKIIEDYKKITKKV